jgi:magnesium transporter
MSKKRIHHKRSHKKGLPPGTLVYTGNREALPSLVNTIWFNDDAFYEHSGWSPEICRSTNGVAWIDIRNLSDTQLIEQVGQHFQLHPLALEDTLDTHQRAKLEEYDDMLFFILPNLRLDVEHLELISEQIAVATGKNYVISFQEDPDDSFLSVRKRLNEGLGRLRKKQSDYLTYGLIDTIVDNYYVIIDDIDLLLLDLETAIHGQGADPHSKARIFELKKVINDFRRRLLPLREAVTRFFRTESFLVDDANRLYLRDIVDHVAQIIDQIDNQREMLSGIESLYHAEVANRLNNVMRLLTVISTIFIPLNFIAGIYGMNFDNMPELHSNYGYFIILGIMFTLMTSMLVYFRVKKWI